MVVKGMKLGLNRFTLMVSLALTTATLGTSMPSVWSQQSAGTITVDGSSTVYPITEAAAEDFQKQKQGKVKVTVGISGTGGGFKKFCGGQTDISDASRPILAKEMAACKQAGIQYIELPIAYDALTVVVNPRNNWAKSLSVAELKKIWEPGAQGKITNWSQVRQGFPNVPLKLYGPGPDSGTFDYFTEAVNGKSKASRTDYTPSENDNVLVQGVSRDRGALGYFGYAYYAANQQRLRAVPIDGGKGAVSPSTQTVENGTYQPLSRPIFIYVNAKSAQRPEVKEFVSFYLNNAAKFASSVRYVPLPAQAYKIATQAFQKPKLGTVFGGDEAVNLRIEQLLQREAKQ
ncbi:PstS family phosphate ABC transporter substrate-binding protein [Mastigocladopsis repens]|uniref:PstS family phosphate ABC transporter substrate-binding protein n=1 Tax=Mastigocladopsis repens TaxID=221287 RepID=UPI0002E8B29C|nr:PstS family phosphate ABC transporter substrate-binding protein [Mastigocladopsis repens]